MSVNLDEQIHAAELAGLAVYTRAVLARAVADEPSVVSLRVGCSLAADLASVVELEFIDRAGAAVAGVSL